MRIQAHTGEVTHHLKGGRIRRFKPRGPMHHITHGGKRVAAKENPVELLGEGGQAARLFVGLNVGTETKWTIDDVITEAVRVRSLQQASKAMSFLAQAGTYEDLNGRLITEPSVQIIVLNLAAIPADVFQGEMLTFGELLVKRFEQEVVIVEMQERGVVKSVYSVTP